MNALLTGQIPDVIDSAHYRPAISVILPFDIKINFKTEMDHALKMAANKVKGELKKKFPEEITNLMMRKLDNIFKHLDFDPGKKSVAIYVSPVFEKVFYLDIAVDEKIIIDESFEIRDLVYSKKQLHKYLVLCVTGKDSRLYLYDSEKFIKVLQKFPESVNAYINEVPERVANFSDISKRKEIVMGKFLNHVDKSLDEVLKTYQLPVLILGPKRTLGYFKKNTRHADSIICYIPGNYAEANFEQLKDIIKPYIEKWKKGKEKELLKQLEAAADKKKLAAGIKEVWHEVINKHGKLLVVEKNYIYAGRHGGRKDVIAEPLDTGNSFSLIEDAVDDLIEKILVDGGDVEFVDSGVLEDYQHIALVKYY
jgi:hypothetical protein